MARKKHHFYFSDTEIKESFAKYEKAELPFEVNYYVAPEREEWKREEMLSWFVQREDWPLLREKGVPDYLQFQEDKILILREGL